MLFGDQYLIVVVYRPHKGIGQNHVTGVAGLMCDRLEYSTLCVGDLDFAADRFKEKSRNIMVRCSRNGIQSCRKAVAGLDGFPLGFRNDNTRKGSITIQSVSVFGFDQEIVLVGGTVCFR